MKKLILHIGMHKTGTSSIQAALNHYDDGTTAYCDLGQENHSIPITTMFSADRYDYYFWRNKGFSDARIDELSQEFEARLNDFIDTHEHQNLIISGEEIRFLESSEKRALVRLFEAKGYTVCIYCLVREPSEFVVSALQQRIKSGEKDIVPINPRYRFSLEEFEKILPKERIFVRKFDEVTAEYGDVVSWFANSLGLKLDGAANTRVNEGLSEVAVKLIFRLNRIPISTFGTPQHVRARQKLINAISDKYPRKIYGSLDKDICQQALSPSLTDDLAYLHAQYSIRFDTPVKPSEQDDVNTYLAELENFDRSGLVELLQEESIPVGPRFTLTDILSLLFFKYLTGPSLEDADAYYLRDIAIKMEKNEQFDLHEAMALMQLAKRIRPNGPVIQKKLTEYKLLLNQEDD